MYFGTLSAVACPDLSVPIEKHHSSRTRGDGMHYQVTDNEFAWFALKVRTRAEDSVRTALEGKGYQVFLPTYLSVRQYSDRIRKVAAPLFPGYVFCRMDPNRRLPVLMTAGVEYAVGFGGRLESLPAAEIDAIQAITQAGLNAQPWPYLRSGNRVQIAFGAMKGVEGLLLKTQGADRLILSIEMLQRSISVEIERAWVRPLTEQSILKTTGELTK